MPIRIAGMNSGLDTDSMVKELVSAYSIKKDKYVKEQTKLSWKQDAWKEMNTKIYNFYSKSLSNLRREGNFSAKKLTVVSDPTKAAITAGSSVMNGTQTLKVNQLATAGYLTGKRISSSQLPTNTAVSSLGMTAGDLKINIGGKEETIKVTDDMTIDGFASALKEKGLNANFDVSQQRFFISSTGSGKDKDFNFVVDSSETMERLDALGLATEEDYKKYNSGADTSDMSFASKTKAANAVIELNGAVFESDSNTFSINGLDITATGVSDLMTITTKTDVDGIYNMVKDFLKEYNELVNFMEKSYNAENAKGYEPLTDDEKSELSDDEIKKWEEKIKDSLFRRDETLNSVLSTMTMNMMKSYNVDGKSYSLSSFGINTAGYFVAADNESYAYHIDGDAENGITGSKTDKLRGAIESDPEAVASFFTQLAKGVYEKLDEKMKSSTLSSAYTVYNDKKMSEDHKAYTDTIKKWEEKVKKMEDSYYKQFAAMETALSKLQSQTNSLTSLLGG